MAVTQQGTTTIKFTAAADAITGRFAIQNIRWVGATATHVLILKDTDGNIFYHDIADAASSDSGFFSKDVNGIVVDTLGSGTVYVDLE